jgi:glutathione S-transferase
MELYFRPMACSLASRIALMEAGLDARYREVVLESKRLVEDDSDFLAVSAKGRVPVLVLDDGRTLTENAAVLQRIADLVPSAGLAPVADDPERYRLQEWLSFVATEIHKAFLYPSFRWDASDAVKAWARERAPQSLAVAAARLAEAPYLLGERFSVADAYLLWSLLLSRFLGVELGAALDAYLERVQQRPAVREAVTLERRLMMGESAR